MIPTDLEDAVDAVVAGVPGFSGVVRVDEGDDVVVTRAYGLADRAHGIPVTIDTRFGLASGSKAFTALVVMHLVDRGVLALDTTARSLLRGDLPLIADDVTVEHLLGHTSGIGDYIDEEGDGEVDDHVLTVPVHELSTTESYLAALDGFPTKFPAGERFSYCNGGFVVLAVLAERASGTPFHDLVQSVVLDPAGMAATGYLRSDELPGDVALGYLAADGLRTNLLHLPVRGTGDGGAQSSAADVHRFWRAVFDGRILPAGRIAQMTEPRSDVPEEGMRYGLGFWLDPVDDRAVMLVGGDAGVSFRTVHHVDRARTETVIANVSSGAWSVGVALAALARR